jgi:myo-inositol-1(or 4)-monophosphatase
MKGLIVQLNLLYIVVVLFILIKQAASFKYSIGSVKNNPTPKVQHHLQFLKCYATNIADDGLKIEEVAQKAAKLAGKVLLDGLGKIDLGNDVISKIGSRDIVTAVDQAAQDVIKSTILLAYPNHDFLGEEDIAPGRAAAAKAAEEKQHSEHLWIVDPLDGTTNFAHGMPLSGIIIAYASKGETLFGLIYDPFREEMFTAWKGRGAFLNGRQIQCCRTDNLKDSVICSGSPPSIDSLDACLRAMVRLSPMVRTMRLLGSAAIMLSWVACGRLTAYFEADLNAWDLAAGVLLIQEAGGKVTTAWGDDFKLTTRNLVATNCLIHDKLLVELQQSEMWITEKPK